MSDPDSTKSGEKTMPAISKRDDLARQAKFIFKGSVQKLRASTVVAVPPTAQTIVARVEEIITAPPTVSQFVGRDITVQFGARQNLKIGQRAVFYANGWLFGESIAVQALGWHPVEEAVTARFAATADPVRNFKNQDLEDRLASADVVVTGKVASVRLPVEEGSGAPVAAVAAGGARAGRGEPAPRKRGPISEHDPKWREAVIEVASAEKGKYRKKEIVVRFPSSNDVRWFKAPKFVPGQEGIFILHKTQKPAEPAARTRATVTAAEAETGEAFTALHPADFQPLEEEPQIRSLMTQTEKAPS